MPHAKRLLCLTAAALAATLISRGSALDAGPPNQPGLVRAQLIYEKAPFPQCHASTIAESKGGLVAAWFGGTRERNPDVGIWVAHHNGKSWSEPVEVANGVQPDGKRHPCWNPILFQPKDAPLLLFYKVGPSPSSWWGMLLTSTDGGKSWSKPRRLPDGFVGPTKNPPIVLSDGSLLCPSSSEDKGWRIHFERTDPQGRKWEMIGPIHDGKDFGAIQPTILLHPEGRLQALVRTRQQQVAETWSSDSGKTWSKLAATELPNNNSGIAGVTLKDGRHLLVYNHTTKGRSPLNVAVSKDGKKWQKVLVLEDQPGEFSYPAVMQASDGRVHVTYTWKRQRVKHAVIDPAKLKAESK
ncbi:MAG: exo-alpha-sialidase [Gemmataceae bacterium]|nr:exo-alpha-sialidase [Gemmataceae bacterium]